MDFDVGIIGAGAAGMMCGAIAGQNDKSVVLIDHAERIGEKIRISGGGRCNFTNLYCGPNNFISKNEHFAKSALARYTQWDFIALVEKHGLSWHEKTKGQLFCDQRSQAIIDMLIFECEQSGNQFRLGTSINGIEDFGLNVIKPEPALVPLTFTDQLKTPIAALSGVSLDTIIKNERIEFDEAMLFTHRGLSGPAILQISSYWNAGEAISINMLPSRDALKELRSAKAATPKLAPLKWLSQFLPTRLAEHFAQNFTYQRLADMPDKELQNLALQIADWHIRPAGTEGYRKAEVTRGGVDTDELSSKTMEAKSVPDLYFIGEVVDVTGHLGGHNFQWAWSSAYACAQAL